MEADLGGTKGSVLPSPGRKRGPKLVPHYNACFESGGLSDGFVPGRSKAATDSAAQCYPSNATVITCKICILSQLWLSGRESFGSAVCTTCGSVDTGAAKGRD